MAKAPAHVEIKVPIVNSQHLHLEALHAKAKAEAGYRFYALYDKISREDILAHAFAQCRSTRTGGVDGTRTGGSFNSQLLLMGLYEFEHTVEFEVDLRHLARIHGGTKTLLGVPPVDPAGLQPVIVCRLVVVEYALRRMQDLLFLHTDPFQLLDHVIEIAG